MVVVVVMAVVEVGEVVNEDCSWLLWLLMWLWCGGGGGVGGGGG